MSLPYSKRSSKQQGVLVAPDAGDSTFTSLPPMQKYPRTSHLFDLGASTDDDLVLSDVDAAYKAFCECPSGVIVEEKIDGANMGFRLKTTDYTILVQNRSRYISSGEHAQFHRVHGWIQENQQALLRVLRGGNLILYGEWCVARHSLQYHRLPGYFVAFDLYDVNEGKFYSRKRFHTTLKGSGIPVVPTIGVKTFEVVPRASKQSKPAAARRSQQNYKAKQNQMVSEIKSLLDTPSQFRTDGGPVEGVVLRLDDDDWQVQRVKVVRPDFIGGCQGEHWTRRAIEKQIVDFAFSPQYMEECYVFAEATCENIDEQEELDEARLTVEDAGGDASGTIANRTATKATAKEQKKLQQQRQRKLRRIPRIIMLMGLPGAGKSTFAESLKEALSEIPSTTCFVANQDDLGRKQCQIVAGKARSRSVRVILDRCNLTQTERQEWLDTMHLPPKSEVALIYFATDTDTCKARVQKRTQHPTIKEGKGRWIVQQLAEKVEPPTQHERRNVFGTVEIVRTSEEAEALLSKWGVTA